MRVQRCWCTRMGVTAPLAENGRERSARCQEWARTLRSGFVAPKLPNKFRFKPEEGDERERALRTTRVPTAVACFSPSLSAGAAR